MRYGKLIVFCILLACVLLIGCTQSSVSSAPQPSDLVVTGKPVMEHTSVEIVLSTKAPATAVPTAEPSPTPVPEPSRVTIGAVGDIMATQGLISAAEVSNGYDFSPVLGQIAPLWADVDIMCANLETVLGGVSTDYSQGTGTGIQTFSAPDELIGNLRGAGFTVLTTANNHCMDRGLEGAIRTIEVLRKEGIVQTGTYVSGEDRKPCIVECNGIKVGILASTSRINERTKYISTAEELTHVNKLFDGQRQVTAELISDVDSLREAGAEYIILFAHWDKEYQDKPEKETRALAYDLIAAGVDCILGSHPHVVQEFEYITVERADGKYTGLVCYSMGNFIANESDTATYGMFVKLTLEKDYSGKVALCDLSYAPTCIFRSASGGYEIHPALPNMPTTTMFLEETDRINTLKLRAYDHVTKICRNSEVAHVMEDYAK
ncbi:MAG: CapA family protein [Eubacteriales bacterium]|nr:CapA family protein [Eubacteriales bacterium]